MSQQKNTLKILLAIIITALVVGIGVYSWQNSKRINTNQEPLQNKIEELKKENAKLRLIKESVDEATAKQEEIDQNFDKCIDSIDSNLQEQEREDAEFKCFSELYDAL